uniref:Potassium voltage-gated channel subfamily E member 4-like protein n=1 Tax=Callorhinchus milii TaxID=7868 RepID=V9LCD5_CALMI|eukprot:gi/632934791/ref/XP_007886501.1/ PREDICTED: potassium voltage-gated channel subfamily E member 4 [Callorhinchus milii]
MDNSNETNIAKISTETAQSADSPGNNEYLYILIVMCFYGIFLLGIVVGYIRSKRHERKGDLMLLYDDRGEWAGLKSLQMPLVFSALPESMVPALSCAVCSIESSISSEAAQDIYLTIEEEEAEGSTNLINENAEQPNESHH